MGFIVPETQSSYLQAGSTGHCQWVCAGGLGSCPHAVGLLVWMSLCGGWGLSCAMWQQLGLYRLARPPPCLTPHARHPEMPLDVARYPLGHSHLRYEALRWVEHLTLQGLGSVNSSYSCYSCWIFEHCFPAQCRC